MDPSQVIPPPPPGFQVVPPQAGAPAIPPPPPGFVAEQPATPAGDVYDAIFPQNGTAPPPPTMGDRALDVAQGVGNTFVDFQRHLLTGGMKGVAALAGAPADLANVSPMLWNLLPGDQGFQPIAERPRGGYEDIYDLLQLPNEAINAVTGTDLNIDQPATGPISRGVQRIGQEIGATLPFLGWGGRLASEVSTGARSLDEMTALERHFAEPMVLNPAGTAGREIGYATAAGAGAQTANELFNQGEQGIATDLAGSFLGAASLAAAGGIGGVARNLYAGATNSPGFMDDIAGQAVADQIINNSTMMGRQAEPFMLHGQAPQLDTAPLAAALRTPAAVEEMVPGYTADIGTRAMDPRLQTFVSDVNARSAGAGNAARVRNTAAVNAEVGRRAPAGDPSAFRQALQQGVDTQLSDLVTEEELARAAFDEAARAVTPQMAGPSARGADIRTGLQDVYDAELARVAELYGAIEGEVDPTALAERFAAVEAGLPMADLRFRPAGTGVPARLAEVGEGAPVPFSEAQAVRSGLSSDIQAARAAGEPRRASIAGQYRGALDEYLENELDPETAAAYQAANRERFDVGRRFEEGNTAIAQSLRRTERGGYVLDPSALPRKFLQPDTGKISDYQALMREAGTDARVREAIADQVLEDARPLLDSPERLRTFLNERNVVLGDFPEVRQRLEDAGVKRETLAAHEQNRVRGTRDLTTPGRSPEASYLRYSNDRVRDSVRQIVNDADPRAATRRLLETAGGDPDATQNLRSAFWKEIEGRGRDSATDLAGQERWNPRKVVDTLKDPKYAAVAEELWRDDPDDLAAIRDLFTSLEAATPGKARAPGSSGTAQAVTGKLDPSLTVTSIASRARSVKRHQMSPAIAGIDLLTTWMRNKSTQVQARAIDTLAAQVVNNPGLAADLLDKFNPATYAASRRMLTQKYGARVTSLLTLLDQAHGEQEPEDDFEAVFR